MEFVFGCAIVGSGEEKLSFVDEEGRMILIDGVMPSRSQSTGCCSSSKFPKCCLASILITR